MTKSDRTLVFAFIGGPRNLSPPAGVTAPHDTLFELTSLPGKLSVFGKSFEEAVREMQDFITHSMEIAGEPVAWYDAEMKRLSQAERALLEKVVGQSVTKGQVFNTHDLVVALDRETDADLLTAGCE